ncbi:hypothetical protein PMIN04_003011 [Paraphaeosphaeria minitans]
MIVKPATSEKATVAGAWSGGCLDSPSGSATTMYLWATVHDDGVSSDTDLDRGFARAVAVHGKLGARGMVSQSGRNSGTKARHAPRSLLPAGLDKGLLQVAIPRRTSLHSPDAAQVDYPPATAGRRLPLT